MKVANNRVFIPIQVIGPTGKSRVVDFWVDSGGGVLALSGRLAKELELTPLSGTLDGMGETAANVITPPRLSLSGLPLDLNGTKTAAHLATASKTVFTGIEAEGFLPAKVLQKYDVVLDYPHGTFTLGRAGVLTHQGTAIPFSVQRKTGFARINLTIDSKEYGFMLDTGAAFTGMSKSLVSVLHAEHPQWPYIVGAVGSANMVGKLFDANNEVLLLANVSMGPFKLRDVGVVSRPTGVYKKYMSQEMSGPIIGALGGNVLRQFRIELDYQNSTAYLERKPVEQPADLGCVGVVLQMRDDGSVLVSGTVKQDDAPDKLAIRFGDQLLKIDGRRITGLSLAAVLSALSGNVGETKKLLLQRSGRLFVIIANVQAYPSCRTAE